MNGSFDHNIFRMNNRVVASLTIMPDKYQKILKTLISLNKQTYRLDEIYLNLPEKSRRMEIDYPPLPDNIRELCTVVPCTDYGPMTKILGGLTRETDGDTIIITFDDDIIYPPTMVEFLLQKHIIYPNSAIGTSGMLLKNLCPFCAVTPNENRLVTRIPKFYIPPEGRRVDSVYGYPGALYVRKFFPRTDLLEEEFFKYALINFETFINDDMTISGYLSLKNIERRIFNDGPEVSNVLSDETGTRLRTDTEISYNIIKFTTRLNNAVRTLKTYGMFSNPEELDSSESVFFIACYLIIPIILIILFIFLIIFFPKIFPPALYF